MAVFPPAKMLRKITPALAIELQTLQNRLDSRRDAAVLAAAQLPAEEVLCPHVWPAPCHWAR
ncbi:MAG: hypothetical protein JSS02_25500 [Planctomycetes bacterium]|nr:hypothetical protein [Planctomycetota bacterium]